MDVYCIPPLRYSLADNITNYYYLSIWPSLICPSICLFVSFLIFSSVYLGCLSIYLCCLSIYLGCLSIYLGCLSIYLFGRPLYVYHFIFSLFLCLSVCLSVGLSVCFLYFCLPVCENLLAEEVAGCSCQVHLPGPGLQKGWQEGMQVVWQCLQAAAAHLCS